MLLAVDGDPDALARTEIELSRRYGQDYTVLTERTAEEAMAVLERLRDEGEPVALVLADQMLGETPGAEVLTHARELHPAVKRGLMIGWGDWANADTSDAISTAMTLGNIDYYVLKPQRCPDELFHRTVAEFLFEWARHESAAAGRDRDRRRARLAAGRRAARPPQPQRDSLRLPPAGVGRRQGAARRLGP